MASPIPDTSPSSSTELNRPCAVRQSRMRWASTGPIPGSASRASSVAEFRSTGADGAGVAPALPTAPAMAGRRGQRRAPPSLHHELLAVDEQPGQVHAGGSRRRCGATCGPDRVDHPRAGREAHQAGVVHGPDDVHHHLGSRALPDHGRGRHRPATAALATGSASPPDRPARTGAAVAPRAPPRPTAGPARRAAASPPRTATDEHARRDAEHRTPRRRATSRHRGHRSLRHPAADWSRSTSSPRPVAPDCPPMAAGHRLPAAMLSTSAGPRDGHS